MSKHGLLVGRILQQTFVRSIYGLGLDRTSTCACACARVILQQLFAELVIHYPVDLSF